MILFLALACTPPEEPGPEPEPDFDPELAAALDEALDDTFGSASAPGAAAAVLLPEEEGVYTWTGGYSDEDLSVAVRPEDTWGIASVTKLFVAAVVLQLEAEGTLSLDDPLSTWETDFPTWADITIAQLLAHTSGIDESPVGTLTQDDPWDEQAYLAELAQEPLRFEPGTNLWYGNANYILLGRVITAATGTSWRDEVRTRILEPHALDHTDAPGDTPDAGVTVQGWLALTAGTAAPSPFGLTSNWGTGSTEMVSTPEDLAHFTDALFAGDLLTAAHQEAMLVALEFDGGPRGFNPYGAELVTSDQGELLVWKDGGAARGHRTRVRWNEDTGAVVVTLSNQVDDEFDADHEALQQSAWDVLGTTYSP